MGSYPPTIGRGAAHDYAPVGVDIDITTDPDNANASVGPAIALGVTASADSALLSVLTAGPNPALPLVGAVTRSFRVNRGDVLRGIAIVKILAATTVTGVRVAWDEAAALGLGSPSSGTTVTANQGTPNGGGNDSWPVKGRGGEQLAVDATLQLITGATTTFNGPDPARILIVGSTDGGGGTQALVSSLNGLTVDVTASVLPTGAATDASITATNAAFAAPIPSTGKLAAGVDGSGNARAIRTNVSGIQNNVPGLGSASDSSAYEPSHVMSAVACEPSRFAVYSKAAGAATVMSFNATSLPANGALPKEAPTPAAPSNRSTTTYANPTGRYSTGLVLAISSTNASLTIAVANDGWFTADFYPTTV